MNFRKHGGGGGVRYACIELQFAKRLKNLVMVSMQVTKLQQKQHRRQFNHVSHKFGTTLRLLQVFLSYNFFIFREITLITHIFLHYINFLGLHQGIFVNNTKKKNLIRVGLFTHSFLYFMYFYQFLVIKSNALMRIKKINKECYET